MGTSIEYEVSTRAICKALGVELVDIPDWSCCGSTPAHTVDHVLSSALAGRTLQQAEALDTQGVITPCPSCLTNLKHASHKMHNPAFKEQVNELLDEPITKDTPVKSVLQVIFEDIGPAELKKHVVKPLKGLRLAPYYGCIMNRPPEVMEFDDHENPIAMDELMKALGADVAPFPLKVECCGASYGTARKDIVMKLSGKLLDAAADVEANAVVAACPLCQMNLDLRQGQINSANRTRHELPVFYYTQLIGLALGLDEHKLGLDKLTVKPEIALRKIEKEKAEATA
jgi:heterodisulfide reductase subunit B